MQTASLLSIFWRFLSFGISAWGGPAVQISLIREALVEKEQWVTPERFNRTLAVYQALPGPEATEMCIYLGMSKAGKWGGLLAGLGYILPGFFCVLLATLLYQAYGNSVFLPLFIGVQPAIAAIICVAVQRMGGRILGSDKAAYLLTALSAIMTVFHIHYGIILPLCGLLLVMLRRWKWLGGMVMLIAMGASALWYMLANHAATIGAVALPDGSVGVATLFGVGLKAGLLSFGGAYTTLPIFSAYATAPSGGWLTPGQLMDGLGIISILPTPVVMLSDFLGFMALGTLGAIAMVVGVFLPAFSITLFGHRYIERLIDNKRLHQFLEGVTAAVIGLLIVTALQLVQASIKDGFALAVFTGLLVPLYFIRHRLILPAVVIVAVVLYIVVKLL